MVKKDIMARARERMILILANVSNSKEANERFRAYAGRAHLRWGSLFIREPDSLRSVCSAKEWSNSLRTAVISIVVSGRWEITRRQSELVVIVHPDYNDESVLHCDAKTID